MGSISWLQRKEPGPQKFHSPFFQGQGSLKGVLVPLARWAPHPLAPEPQGQVAWVDSFCKHRPRRGRLNTQHSLPSLSTALAVCVHRTPGGQEGQFPEALRKWSRGKLAAWLPLAWKRSRCAPKAQLTHTGPLCGPDARGLGKSVLNLDLWGKKW